MKFEKVSFEEWERTVKKIFPNADAEDIEVSYNNIQLPKRSTEFAAGYDFFMPFGEIEFFAEEWEGLLIPTGVRWIPADGEENHVLVICPRSGLGMKYGVKLKNTIGIIDADYYGSSNEGHIMANIICDKSFSLKCGDRFIQGIIIPYVICGETVNIIRDGGFGSTGE